MGHNGMADIKKKIFFKLTKKMYFNRENFNKWEIILVRSVSNEHVPTPDSEVYEYNFFLLRLEKPLLLRVSENKSNFTTNDVSLLSATIVQG